MFDGSRWTQWTREDGLAGNHVPCLQVDAFGQVWAGTDRGLSRYTLRTTGIALGEPAASLPGSVVLYPNYPNPFNPLTTIAYDLPEASHVTLTIYAVTGQKVGVLVSGHQEAGHHVVAWDGIGFGTGIYLSRLQAGSFTQTRKALLLR